MATRWKGRRHNSLSRPDLALAFDFKFKFYKVSTIMCPVFNNNYYASFMVHTFESYSSFVGRVQCSYIRLLF